LVGPKPTPKRMRISPGFTGRLANENAPGGPMMSYPAPLLPGLPGVRTMAAGYLAVKSEKEGA
jgi:hypothetical protein